MAASPKRVVEDFFRLMHTWDDMEFLELFDNDAVYIEPFAGKPRRHRGVAAIKASFLDSWKQTPPNFRIRMGQVSVSGSSVRAEWSCTWDGLDGEMKGVDDFEILDGRIRRLEVTVTAMPPIPQAG
jgi:ketosteroid isomerase-like protein